MNYYAGLGLHFLSCKNIDISRFFCKKLKIAYRKSNEIKQRFKIFIPF